MANPNKVGLVIGALIGSWHLCWSILVLLRWAQPIIDFIFWAHMAAITLIVITAATGYIFGFVGAVIWNRLHR